MAKGGWTKNTRVASVRLDLKVWEQLDFEAAGEGSNVNDKLKELIEAYVNPPPEPRVPGKTTRWAQSCDVARDALGELLDMRGEYEEWLGNMPENLQVSATAQKLEEVTSLDIESALAFIDEAYSIDLPLGFGRD